MKPRAAIYARFSTDLQSERSVDDQVALCRDYATREGLDVAAVFSDRGKSGASIFGREGLLALMVAAKEGAFECVLVEHSDRLARSMRDTGDIFDRLSFLGIELRAVHSGGRLDGTMAGLFGLVGQMQREEGAKKVRRGLAGLVRSGKHAGGRAFGYRPTPDAPSGLAIDEDERPIVMRIFEEYAAGRTPRDIAHGLNRDGVQPPRGRTWNASALNGSRQRGSGILQNELYAGRITWNKVRMLKDPDTGRRVSRANPHEEWMTSPAPELAIVDEGLFAAAKARKAAHVGIPATYQRRPRHALSGLLKCGSCGSGLSTNGRDKSGRIRVRCTAAAESGTCPDPKTFYLDTIEGAVFGGLRAELREPAVLSEYVRAYHEERARLGKKEIVDRSRLQRRLAQLKREVDRTMRLLIDEVGDQHAASEQNKAAAVEMRAVEARLAAEPEPAPPVALHPATLARYEVMIGRLGEALAAGAAGADEEGMAAIRDLVRSVTVRRGERGGSVEIVIEGRLNALLGDEAYPNGLRRVWGEVVAGEGLEPPTPGL